MLEEEGDERWRDVNHGAGVVSWVGCDCCDCVLVGIGCQKRWFSCHLVFDCGVECCVRNVD